MRALEDCFPFCEVLSPFSYTEAVSLFSGDRGRESVLAKECVGKENQTWCAKRKLGEQAKNLESNFA